MPALNIDRSSGHCRGTARRHGFGLARSDSEDLKLGDHQAWSQGVGPLDDNIHTSRRLWEDHGWACSIPFREGTPDWIRLDLTSARKR